MASAGEEAGLSTSSRPEIWEPFGLLPLLRPPLGSVTYPLEYLLKFSSPSHPWSLRDAFQELWLGPRPQYTQDKYLCLAFLGPGRYPKILRVAPAEVWHKTGLFSHTSWLRGQECNSAGHGIPPCFHVASTALPRPGPLRTPTPTTSRSPAPPPPARKETPSSALTSGGTTLPRGSLELPSCRRKPARVRSRGAQEGESAMLGCPSGPDDHHVTPAFLPQKPFITPTFL